VAIRLKGYQCYGWQGSDFKDYKMTRRIGMKAARNILMFVLSAVGGTVSLAGNAMAAMGMPEKEAVQAIAWAVEIVAFITAVAIAWFVLRLVKRERKNIKPKKDNS
jgi:hypothetical protein